jgi:hypothetical protein
MAEPKPLPRCFNCDEICLDTPDGECWGRLSKKERFAFAQALVSQEKYLEINIDEEIKDEDESFREGD